MTAGCNDEILIITKDDIRKENTKYSTVLSPRKVFKVSNSQSLLQLLNHNTYNYSNRNILQLIK
jgi:hypothetical protein